MRIKRLLCALCLTLLISNAVNANPELDAAIVSDLRTDEDKQRDASRKPKETLSFFEVKPDSKVLELVPGGGWYTRILANYLKDQGELYLALGVKPEFSQGKFSHVNIVGNGFESSPTELHPGIRELTDGNLGVKELDIALTFRNMHNLTEDARLVVNKAVYDALKPGGIYGVIDHTQRHMQAYDEETWRRVDPVQIIKELLSIGFEFDDFSKLHSQPNDELIYDTTDDSLNRNSDRFTLKFRKPK